MKKSFLSFVLVFASLICVAQIDWKNYSTSYQPRVNIDATPLLVTAIPYNGIWSNFSEIDTLKDDKGLLSLDNIINNASQFYVYDSSAVHFFAPGIYKSIANEYEFCVLLNGKSYLKQWGKIDSFSNEQLNNFRKGFAYLGGFKADWNNYLLVEIRKNGNENILSSSLVYWKLQKPVLSNVYTINQLADVFKQMNIKGDTPDWAYILKSKFNNTDNKNSNDSISNNLVFKPNDNNLFFFVNSGIYKKEAMQYELIKNGDIVINWQPNEFDNNFIWLKNLDYGNYILKVRFKRQPQSIAEYSFKIPPAWQQTNAFKIISAILITAFIGFIIIAFRFIKQKRLLANSIKAKTVIELKSIRSQLNPHFIFNALSSIQGLINKNEIDDANKYLSGFGRLMRNTLEGGDKENSSLETEIKMLDNYLQLEQLRFHFKYSIKSTVNNAEVEIPTALLQPLAENAVKHGVSSLHNRGTIYILFEQKAKDMVVRIIDNGNGFDKTMKTSGYGLKLTNERIALLNSLDKTQKIEMGITQNNGTDIYLTFKNWF